MNNIDCGDVIRVVGRSSRLSVLQVKEFFSLYPLLSYQLTTLKSLGDKNKHISLMDNIAGDFFTRELDEAVLKGKADVAIHSAKDLPYPLPRGLELFCLTMAKDKTDSLVSRNKMKLSELPSGARIGTSSKNRKDELLKLRADLTVVSIRGTIEERIAQVENGDIDALIVATCALRRLGLEELITEVLPFRTHPLQGNLAVVGKKESKELKLLFSEHDLRKKYGKVTLVGFGPGNPDLLTIRGDKALKCADIIFHDDLIDRNFLDKYSAPKIYVGKRKGNHSFCQDEINELIYQAAISGQNVVRLKGGDPMVFAHGREEIDYLKSRFVEVNVIPGISSGIALASLTHIPLTHRGISSSVAFVTGHSLEKIHIPDANTIVFYMAGANISGIAKQMIALGRNPDTPVALVYNVSLPDQKTFYTTLKELRFSVVKYPTPLIVVVGEVVAFESRVAPKQNILVTGTTSRDYEGDGNIIHSSLIRIEKNRDQKIPALLKSKLSSFHWIVFTSRYGVRFFFEILREIKFDIRALGGVKIASVGRTTTAELNRFHLHPDIESETQSAEGLISYFERAHFTGKNILLPRSDKGLKFLLTELTRLGNMVTDLPIYNNLENNDIETVDLAQFQKIYFSSPSGVDSFKRIYGEFPEGVQLVAKGKTTEHKIKLELNEKI